MTYALNIKQIRQSLAQLAATNPVLSAFQLCIETDIVASGGDDQLSGTQLEITVY